MWNEQKRESEYRALQLWSMIGLLLIERSYHRTPKSLPHELLLGLSDKDVPQSDVP